MTQRRVSGARGDGGGGGGSTGVTGGRSSLGGWKAGGIVREESGKYLELSSLVKSEN